MKVAFYIDNEEHRGIDYSHPECGNPGIGGTHYMFWTVAYYLKNMYEDVEVYIFAPMVDSMPLKIKSIECSSPAKSVILAGKYDIDILVLRGVKDDLELFRQINLNKQKTIFWTHNPLWCRLADQMAECDYVLRNVCVGKEQLDRLRDHKVFQKSTYIYNALDYSIYDGYESEKKTRNIVGYMGSLTEKKGFHRLAKVWKEVVRRVPDAELYVLGGGNLYGKDWSLGSLNISNPSYEKKIKKYLCDDSGRILPSVHFLGVVSGEKKLRLIQEMTVGVVNPMGNETFCIVAIEFEYLKVPVVTVKKDGVLDTVLDNRTGLLFKTNKEFVNDIVALLENKERAQEMGNAGHVYVLNNFEIHQICSEWKKLLDDCYSGRNMDVTYKAKNWLNSFKWLRELNRRIKSISCFSWLPSMLWYKQVIRDIYKGFR